MEVVNRPTIDLFEQQPKTLPGMLNVLTILTFIGCGLSYLSLLYSFFTASAYQQQIATLQEMGDQLEDNEVASKMMQGSIDVLQKSYDYRYILLLSGVVFTTLCLIGALQMRKLKKNGFTLYLIGEIAPVVLTGALLGFSLVGGLTIIMSSVFALVFVILYATQKKHLVH